jgi:hypothetical protein
MVNMETNIIEVRHGQIIKKITENIEMNIFNYIIENGDEYIWGDRYEEFIGGDYNHSKSLCYKFLDANEKSSKSSALLIKAIYKKIENI